MQNLRAVGVAACGAVPYLVGFPELTTFLRTLRSCQGLEMPSVESSLASSEPSPEPLEASPSKWVMGGAADAGRASDSLARAGDANSAFRPGPSRLALARGEF